MNASPIPSISPRRLWAIPLCALLLGSLVAVSTWKYYPARQPLTLTLDFAAQVADQALVFNQFVYANPAGDGSFKIRDFMFYLSHITLHSAEGDYQQPASYHLLRFDNAKHAQQLLLTDVPRHPYTSISFALGVDPQANNSLQVMGDLDPNGRMAWNWEVGYKFVLFEGALQRGEKLQPLVYHIGFDENYVPLSFPLIAAQLTTATPKLQFGVDIMKLFSGADAIDMASLPSVKFDRTDARRIASNYAQMITLADQSR